jgi:fucose 4-O-acetylase-like acetyltransferase
MTLSKNISYAKPRNHAIDIMKGLTILLVIVGHEQRLPQWVIDSIYSFHMPLFFIVAGYFYKPSTEYTKRIAKDTKRLILPYLAVMLVVTAYIFIVHIVFKPGGDIVFWQSLWACLYPTNLRHHLDVARSVPVWFLLALFWCRQIYNFIYCSFKRTRYVWIIIISVGILLFNDFIRIDLPLAFSQGCSAMIFYFGGVCIE